jgi:plasmid stability protein
MPSVIIRNMHPQLHRRLKEKALSHHRSMNREILSILEKELKTGQARTLPPLVKTLKPVDPDFIVNLIRQDRDSRS